jgi:hypothetical protein
LQAEAYAAEAFEAYGRKEYAASVALYRRAYDAAPSADALYNIARVYDLGLRDRPLAIAAYRRLLADPGATPDRIRLANERLQDLREAELAVLELDPAPAGELALRPAPTGSVPAPKDASEPEHGSDGSTSRVAALVSGAAGLVSLGLGIGFGIRVLADADTANASCVENRCTSQRAVNAAKAASTNATVATVGVSVGVGLIATSAVLWLASRSDPEADAPAGVNVTPLASASELGLTLSGGW